ncbi:hypothetical protein HY463_01285 [Candidatus Peregrinibacteria bacterium]|nr:hypothetical protein [Candidatus Peregrinibacteria bacterium]
MKKIYLAIAAAIIFWSLALNAFAAIQLDETYKPDNLPSYQTQTGSGEIAATQTVALFVGKIVGQILLFLGAVTVVFIIIAGAKYIFAFGNDDRLGQAKRGMTWSIVGLILIMLSYAIVRGVIKILISTDVAAK